MVTGGIVLLFPAFPCRMTGISPACFGLVLLTLCILIGYLNNRAGHRFFGLSPSCPQKCSPCPRLPAIVPWGRLGNRTAIGVFFRS